MITKKNSRRFLKKAPPVDGANNKQYDSRGFKG